MLFPKKYVKMLMMLLYAEKKKCYFCVTVPSGNVKGDINPAAQPKAGLQHC